MFAHLFPGAAMTATDRPQMKKLPGWSRGEILSQHRRGVCREKPVKLPIRFIAGQALGVKPEVCR
jgi:hypothetical protein